MISTPATASASDEELGRIVRREAGLITAQLQRRLGDFDVAEEAVQDSIVAALRTWRSDGVPVNPGGWLALAARRRAIDLLRRRTTERRALAALAADPGNHGRHGSHGPVQPDQADQPRHADQPTQADERLPMLFGCCHPALRVEARLALTLRSVIGMTTPQIASAFLVPEATMAQRLVRAKRKITSAGIPFLIPVGPELAGRLDDVLTVVYLSYNAGYLEPPPSPQPLSADAVWLAELIARSLPDQAEAWGVLALLTFLDARAASRFDEHGSLVLLAEQDRTRWDTVAVARADGYLTRAAAMRRPGRFQLHAAIAGCHATASTAADTDWLQILTLYDVLVRLDPSPVVQLNRAIALAEVAGPAAALVQVDALATRLADYHILHATRGQLLERLGDRTAALRAHERALSLAHNPVERDLLRARTDRAR